ncbi:MAG TPA: hypothetical protein PLO05_03780 [Bacteroidales bacterium]|nr:hypothetical protein [Bacteroidales bacterium]HXK81258.1 hypothetical protein [Bacteroidales bacterium]
MGFADWYFKRFVSYDINIPIPSNNTQIVVVIPVHNEPELLNLINNLWECNVPDCNVAVIVIVNDSISSSFEIKQQNKNSIEKLKLFKESHSQEQISLHYYHHQFKDKHAGVGSARKIGMDTAIKWFNHSDNPNGIIASLDADVKIEPNYLTAIYDCFKTNTNYGAAVLRFQHPIDGEKFSKNIYDAIAKYELYLRYFRLGLEFAGYPHAIHTIGSCFAVKAENYIKVGGMNKRQGGEDFYFLHKITSQTNIGSIFETCVYPSPRVSSRVPFGTGPEVNKILNSSDYCVYHPILFKMLKKWFSSIEIMYKYSFNDIEIVLKNIDPIIYTFAKDINFEALLADVKLNSSSFNSFKKRFFTKINAFQIIKFLNYASFHYPKISVEQAVTKLLEYMHIRAQDKTPDLIQQLYKHEYNI